MPGTTLVLGLGDIERADDGLGPLALAALQRGYALDKRITTLDAPAVGVRLLPLLATMQHLLVLAVVRLGAPPGTLHRLEWRGAPDQLEPRLPQIRSDGVEILRMLHFWIDPVPELVLLGIEGETGSRSGGTSASVDRALPQIVQAAAEELRRWGHSVAARAVPGEPVAA